MFPAPTRFPVRHRPKSRRPAHAKGAVRLTLAALVMLEIGLAEGSEASKAHRPESPDRVAGLDLREQTKLRSARRLAGRRVAEVPACSALFDELARSGTDTLREMSIDLEADPAGCRRGIAAFTQIGGSVVSLCREWLPRLDRYQLAALLIHEALHHAGLAEAPQDPTAPSSVDINRMVWESCGF